MGRYAPHYRRAQTGIVSYLLLVLLASGLFHSSLHIFDRAGDPENPAWPQSAIQKQSTHGAGSGSSAVPPCLTCNCQKHNFAVLSSHALPVGPAPI